MCHILVENISNQKVTRFMWRILVHERTMVASIISEDISEPTLARARWPRHFADIFIVWGIALKKIQAVFLLIDRWRTHPNIPLLERIGAGKR